MARARRSTKDTPTRSKGKEEESKFPPSCGGAWWQKTKDGDEYLNGMVSSAQDKETLQAALDEVLEDDTKKLKLLLFENQYKKSDRAPDMVVYVEVIDSKK